jgi:DNA-binding transcriptional LysR family regulator
MDFKVLQNFKVLAQELNFTKTSERLNIVQPALSKQIANLEEELKVQLFFRTKRKVSLTDAGIFLERELDRMLKDWQNIEEHLLQIQEQKAGILRIGHSSTAMHTVLPQSLHKLKKEFPFLKTELLELSNIELVEHLKNRAIDLALGPNLWPRAELSSQTIYQENFCLILPSDHDFEYKTNTGLADLAHENFIIPPLSAGTGYVETVYDICRRHGFSPKSVYESANTNSVLRLVEAGLGLSIEPMSSLKGYELNLKVIELKHEPIKVEMQLINLKERQEELKLFLPYFQA